MGRKGVGLGWRDETGVRREGGGWRHAKCNGMGPDVGSASTYRKTPADAGVWGSVAVGARGGVRAVHSTVGTAA